MNKYKLLRNSIVLTCIAVIPETVTSATNAELESQVKQLNKDLAEMRVMMAEMRNIQVTKKEVERVQKQVEKVTKTQLETANASSQAHLAGYAQINYSAIDQSYIDDGEQKELYNAFSNTTFAPIFHYQYNDLLMFEAELAVSIDAVGETDVELEYSTADLIINDNATLLLGKFLSPLGQFRQNIHPGWINKLPNAPAGFGHDQAAPIANVGAQVRGGFYLLESMFNYAAYVGNGPQLESGGHGGGGIGVAAVGTTSNNNNQLTYGGRIGVMPISGLEIGLSGALGKAALTFFDDEEGIERTEDNRDYDVFGADFVYNWKSLQARGEYISQSLGGYVDSEVDPDSNEWTAWYLQSSYKFSPTKWEGVLRYGDYDAPGLGNDKKQWSLGVNYLFANNIIAKLSYDINDGEQDTLNDEDAVTLQMTYGF
jgi:hypothetical protein